VAEGVLGTWAGSLVSEYYERGFLVLPDLLPASTVVSMRRAFDDLEAAGELKVGDSRLIDHTDIIFTHGIFAAVLREPLLVELLVSLLGPSVELYDSKFINKPRHDIGLDAFAWHQDFAFYPHTNFDLLALGVHLDNEDDQSGCVRVLPGSHKWGPRSHTRNGDFIHQLADQPDGAEVEAVSLTGSAGFISLHHCLLVHCSDRKQRSGDRRVAYYDIRAQDNVQLAGYIRRSAGYRITPAPDKTSRYARFPDGRRVELRGSHGRLHDSFGRLASDAGHVGELGD
jgi:phytanoyl-CoA hydroxylase